MTQTPADPGAGAPPEGIPDREVIEGVRPITQSPFFDPEIDDEDEMEETK